MTIIPVFIPIDPNAPMPDAFPGKYKILNAILIPVVVIAAFFMGIAMSSAWKLSADLNRSEKYGSEADPQTALSVLFDGTTLQMITPTFGLFLFGFLMVFALTYSKRIWPAIVSGLFLVATVFVVVMQNTPAG